MVKKKYDVFNVGVIVADIPIKLPLEQLDFQTDSMLVETVSVLPGGDATNSSIVLTDLGKRVLLAGCIGDDLFGKTVLDKLVNRGLDISQIKIKKELSTQTSFVMINCSGDRCFLVSGASNFEFCIDDVNTSLLRQCRHLNFGSFFGLPKLEKDGAVALFQIAKENGLSTSADTVNDSFNSGLKGIRDILPNVDYFFPSYVEARYLTQETDPEKMADYLINKTGQKTIVIKLGEKGCFLKNATERFYMDAFIEKPVDTTGAGDNFVAGFISFLLEGHDLYDCAKFACATAAYSIKSLGATGANISREKVLNYLNCTKQAVLHRS